MTYQVRKLPLSIQSTDGDSVIRGYTWEPEMPDEPKGIIQLLHGMSEYIDRYDDFARYLAADGFLVVGHDHIGHGLSQPDQSKRGCLPLNGNEVMIADANAVRAIIAERHRTVPVFVFGHSMGSFVARAIAARWGKKDLAGVVFCGTGFVNPVVSGGGRMLAKVIARTQGLDTRSNLLHSLADGAYAKAIPQARTSFDWLNTQPAQVDKYIEDPACGFMFSAGGYSSLLGLLQETCSSSHFENASRYTRVLYIAGDQDPVGDNGKGVWEAANRIKKGGAEDVKVVLYPGMRHEILNEKGHEEVYADVRNWLNHVDKH